jgi:hypothetical protein
MTDVMQRCVPISTGALAPDLRVNYQFGLVLGVDEFEQEDLYFRERDERASRVLHGYGTATGLHVTAGRPGVAPTDVEVRVEPGVAIDQFGRPVVVRSAQCARVGAWLAGEEQRAAADRRPSPMQAHVRPSGDLTLYVVAEYSSCLDALVPLPGNPCGCDDDVTAPSRVRDSWNLGFRWEPPVMPHWDGVRALADLLNPIELHDGSPLHSDELALAAHVRALATGAAPPAPVLPAIPMLPRADARAALDRLLTIWVTEVRPTLAPDLVQPVGEAAILLSTLTVVPAAAFSVSAPEITAFSMPDDEGRPYLAPTQLIQELVSMGGGAATIVTSSPIQIPAPVPLVQLAELVEVGQGGGRQLLLWNHLPAQLVLPAAIPVSRNGGAPVAFATGAGPVAGTFRLTPAAQPLADGELLELTLDLTVIRVRAGGGMDVALPAWLQQAGVDLLGRDGNELRLRHVTAPTPVPAPPPPPPPPTARPVRQLITAVPVLIDRTVPAIELWWHVDKEPQVDEERVKDLPVEAVEILAEVETPNTPVPIPFTVKRVQHNVFQLVPDVNIWRKRGMASPYLRVLVELRRIELSNFGGDPVKYAEDLGVVWEDAQRDGGTLAVWVRMNLAGVP